MRCQLCKKKAVISSPKLCKEHFIKYYEKKFKERLEKLKIRGKRILIAVSGGKDSSVLAYLLHKYKKEFQLDLMLFYIDLGIKEYSKKGLKAVKILSELINEPLQIYDLKALHGYSIDDFHYKPCSYCGVIKRYIINKFAFENGFDYIAIGHNLDDELFFIMNNLFNQDLHQLSRIGMKTETIKEYKLIGRIKPLYYFTEKENMLYAVLKKIPFDNTECPHAKNSTQLQFKQNFNFSREKKLSLVKAFNKIKKYLPKEEIKLNLCEKCGYATTSKICKFCRIDEMMRKVEK